MASLQQSVDDAVNTYKSVREEYMNARDKALSAEAKASKLETEIQLVRARIEKYQSNLSENYDIQYNGDEGLPGETYHLDEAQIEEKERLAEQRAEEEFQKFQLEEHLHALTGDLASTEAQATEQHAIAKSFEEDLNHAEQVKDNLAFQHHKLAAQEREQQQQEVKKHTSRLEQVQRDVKKIVPRVQNMEDNKIKSVQSAVESEASQIDRGIKNLIAAKHGSSKAAERVRSQKLQQKDARMSFKHDKQKVVEQRAKAIIQLKQSIEKVSNEIQGTNERKARAKHQQAQQEAAEFKSLLDDRKNPYEVFRRRKLEAKLLQEEKSLQHKIQVSKMKMVKGIIEFDEYALRKEEEEKKAKTYESNYRDSLGRHLHEHKTREFIKAITVDGVESIDPSGRGFRLQPSQFTDLKLHSFGLGKKPCDSIIEKMSEKPSMRGVEANQMLVSRSLESDSPQQGNSFPASATTSNSSGMNFSIKAKVPGMEFGGGMLTDTNGKDEEDDAFVGDDVALVEDGNEEPHTSANRYWPELSVLEQKMLENARQRQKEGLVKEQVVWGKSFKGVAFLAKPVLLEFKDFDVGKSYKQKFTLSNVSYTFNMFKFLGMPKRVQNYFELKYTKPGRMSAGTSCTLTLKFKPKLNEDIEFSLEFLAQTGPFSVPVRCLRKRASPSLSANIVQLGHVVLGETVSKSLRISNQGALEVKYKIVTESEIEAIDKQRQLAANSDSLENIDKIAGVDDESQLPVNPYLHLFSPETNSDDSPRSTQTTERNTGLSENVDIEYPKEGVIPKYAFRILPFQFSPQPSNPVGPVKLRLFVVFDDSDTAPEPLQVSGVASDTPIFVEHEEVDLKCCVVGKQYRARIVFCNRGNVSLLVDLNKATNSSAVQFNPSFGFVQARERATGKDGRLEVQVKFTPDETLLEDCEPGISIPALANGPTASGKLYPFSVPLLVKIHGQTLPLQCKVSGTLTRGEIEFSIPAGGTIHLGACFTSQSVKVPLRMTNKSALPQKYGFVKLHSQVSIEPDLGFGLLLPFETRTINIIYGPSAATEQVFQLECRTSMNHTYTWRCKGRGVEPALQLSSSKITFGAAAVGNVMRQSITLSNVLGRTVNTTEDGKGNGSRYFEFVLSESQRSQLKITPQVGLVAPGQSTRVQIEFRARKGPVTNSISDKGSTSSSSKSTAMEIDNGEALSNVEGTGSSGTSKVEGTGSSGTSKVENADKTDDAGSSGTSIIEGADKPDDAGFSGASNVEDSPPTNTKNDTANEVKKTCELSTMECASQLGVIEPSRSDEPWSVHADWIIPCYVKSGKASTETSCGSSSGIESTATPLLPKNAPPLLFLNVKTVTVTTELWADRDRVNFGDVAVGHSKTITIKLRNFGEAVSDMRCDGLNPLGAFSILNSLRPIQPRGKHTVALSLQFSPLFNKTFTEELVLLTDTGMVQIRLSGKGVCPKISVEGIDADGRLDFGSTMVGEKAIKQFTVRNTSKFPVNYWIDQDEQSIVPSNFNGKPAFTFQPVEAWVAPGASVQVRAEYAADRELQNGAPHKSTFVIRTPNASSDVTIQTHGQCWNNQMYVSAKSGEIAPSKATTKTEETDDVHMTSGTNSEEDSMSDPNIVESVQQNPPCGSDWVPMQESLALPPQPPTTEQDGTALIPKLYNPPQVTYLEFRGESKAKREAVLSIGCLNGKLAIPAGGSYELSVFPAEVSTLFRLSSTRGTLKPGGSETVTVKFNPKGTAAIDAVQGEWIEGQLTCELKGGYLAPATSSVVDGSETQVVKFGLKGLI